MAKRVSWSSRNNPSDLSQAIVRLLSDRDLRERLGMRAASTWRRISPSSNWHERLLSYMPMWLAVFANGRRHCIDDSVHPSSIFGE